MAWKKKSRAIMVRDHYECQECRKRLARIAAGEVHEDRAAARRIRPAALIHHIVPLEVDRSLALDDDDLEAVCERCHNIIHGRVGRVGQTAKKRVTEEKW